MKATGPTVRINLSYDQETGSHSVSSEQLIRCPCPVNLSSPVLLVSSLSDFHGIDLRNLRFLIRTQYPFDAGECTVPNRSALCCNLCPILASTLVNQFGILSPWIVAFPSTYRLNMNILSGLYDWINFFST